MTYIKLIKNVAIIKPIVSGRGNEERNTNRVFPAYLTVLFWIDHVNPMRVRTSGGASTYIPELFTYIASIR